MTVPPVIAGTLAIVTLYMAIRPAFGRIVAVSAALALALIPSSVAIDSRNEPDSLQSLRARVCESVTGARPRQEPRPLRIDRCLTIGRDVLVTSTAGLTALVVDTIVLVEDDGLKLGDPAWRSDRQ